MNKRNLVIISPFIIMAINLAVAYDFGKMIGKWAFAPVILIEWALFIFFIIKYKSPGSLKGWLKQCNGKMLWKIISVLIGLTAIPIFLLHRDLLSGWTIWLPWLLIALINPWLEEFYWRGLLSDATRHWKAWQSVLFTSSLFALNHLVFGMNAQLFRGPEVLISTFIMGVIWAITYKKTGSLRWVIFAHFLVDFFNLSVPSFLDLYKGWQ